MFVRYGLALSCMGIVAGAVAAAGLSRLMAGLLFGVPALDPVTYTSTALILLAVAIGAMHSGAARAAAGNPLEALRGE
jgi:putative ABC transport system permease protein